MRINMVPWPLYSVRTRERKINPKPAQQRGPVWSLPQKQLLIDSILRGYDIPKLYLRCVNEPRYEFEVVDGQQRLRAIWEFFRGEYPLSKEADPVNEHEIAGKKYDELHDDLKEQFQGFVLHFTVFDDAPQEIIDDMFVRLQNGVPLNSAEKRNAISGAMRDFVRDLASEHPFFTKSIGFENKRYSYHEVLAQITLVELNGGPCTVGHPQLKDMYEKGKTFKPDSAKAKRIRAVLNFLVKAFPQKTGELSKVNVLSLYILASELLTKFAITGKYREFGQWFLDFEARRREDEARDADQRDSDLMQYQLYLSQGTASQTALNHRHRVLMRDLLLNIPNLELLDPQRGFDEYQRLAIFRKYDGKCANPYDNPDCQVTCEWDNFHADHIKPWTAGGKTTVDNGQLLCPSCNQKKGSKVG
jgi:hypothetical protein